MGSDVEGVGTGVGADIVGTDGVDEGCADGSATLAAAEALASGCGFSGAGAGEQATNATPRIRVNRMLFPIPTRSIERDPRIPRAKAVAASTFGRIQSRLVLPLSMEAALSQELTRRTTLSRLLWGAACLVGSGGCSMASLVAPAAPTPPPSPPPRGLASTELARDLIDGRVGALFHVRDFRSFPNAGSIGVLGSWAEVIEALGLDPMFDVERVFVTSHVSSDTAAVDVIELGVADDVIRAAFSALGARGTYAELELSDQYAVAVSLVAPRRLAVAPKRLAANLPALGRTRALPKPHGKESAEFFSFEPNATVSAPPTWPSTLLFARAEIEILRGGGAAIRFFGESTSVERAARDARALTEEARRLLTLSLGFAVLEILDPPVFHADAHRVVMSCELSPDEVDWLLRIGGNG